MYSGDWRTQKRLWSPGGEGGHCGRKEGYVGRQLVKHGASGANNLVFLFGFCST